MKIIIVAGEEGSALDYVDSIEKKSRYIYWVRTKTEASKDIKELLQKGAFKVST